MNPAFSIQILIGLSAAYFIWPGGPVPRVKHRIVASAWSFLSRLPGSGASSSSKSRWSWAKDKLSAGGSTDSSAMSLEDVPPNSTAWVPARFSQEDPESRSDRIYAVILFVLFGVLGSLWVVCMVRSTTVDAQVRRSIEKKIPGPVKKGFGTVKGILGSIVEMILIAVKKGFVPLQQLLDPVVKKVFTPIKRVFRPIIMILLVPVENILALVRAIIIFIMSIPKSIQNNTLGPIKRMQEEEAAKFKVIIDEQIEQLRVSADGLKKTCGTLEERNEHIQQQLNKLSSRVESINQWQRESEFYFMRPNETGARKADEQA
ncbi:hypothetical protein BDW68DRAFT_17850 [Aspergillus falconensis]